MGLSFMYIEIGFIEYSAQMWCSCTVSKGVLCSQEEVWLLLDTSEEIAITKLQPKEFMEDGEIVL